MTSAIAEKFTAAAEFDDIVAMEADFSGWTTISSHRTSEGMLHYMRNIFGEMKIVVRPY